MQVSGVAPGDQASSDVPSSSFRAPGSLQTEGHDHPYAAGDHRDDLQAVLDDVRKIAPAGELRPGRGHAAPLDTGEARARETYTGRFGTGVTAKTGTPV
jgi:hypothetical protein